MAWVSSEECRKPIFDLLRVRVNEPRRSDTSGIVFAQKCYLYKTTRLHQTHPRPWCYMCVG